jgi:signal transduction histidine kinase
LAALNDELAQRNGELAAAVADRDRLMATVSHEMRAPLTLVIGLAQTLRSAWDQLSEEDKFTFLAKVEQRGQQLAAIVDDLIVLGRVERDGGGDGVCEVASVIREAIEATSVKGDVTVSCAPGLVARADPGHVGRILINYLTNAARYGAPPLVVEARAEGEWIDIRVTDEGPGVPPEFVGELFEPFTRSVGARQVAADGSGLGLAIVQELARAEGGEAWYEQNSPQGSCFAVRLPA